MHDWCAPIERALSLRHRPCQVFFRDDDAGWDDPALFALLDRYTRRAVPIDLAVIPSALTQELAHALLQRIASGSRIGLHQHGYAHLNHEPEGRKYEFGPSLPPDRQRGQIETGHAIIAGAFGTLADPIFTPPWNRCTEGTARLLTELGFAALSRDHSAARFDIPGLAELPVTVDWCKLRRPGSSPEALAQRISACLADADRCGIMLHHAAMDRADLELVDSLLTLLGRHPMCRHVGMAELLPECAPSRPPEERRSLAPLVEGD